MEKQEDVVSIEKSSSFFGIYHILNGALSPIDGITPQDINIGSFMNRVKNTKSIREVIIATNPTVNGELTANYLSKALKSLKNSPNVFRIGFGLAMGSEISYVDKLTMMRSFQSKIKF